MKEELKRILPQKIKPVVRYWITLLSKYFSILFQINGVLSSYYYAFFSRQFDREHNAVLAGKVAYQYNLSEIGDSCALLRRNIHRIEKGLIMRPRRRVFAEQYILETVKLLQRANNIGTLCDDEKKWCVDVLKEYFSVIDHSSVTRESERIFRMIEFYENKLENYIPYQYSTLKPHEIEYEDIKNLFIKRRSVRWYKNKHVPLDLINKATDIASLAPTACNRQPYRFLFCNNKKKTIKIANCVGGTKGFADNLSAIIVIVGDLSAYQYERDRHLIYIDSSLAAMQLMLALETLGLSTCSINWPEVKTNERKIRKIIDLKNYERIVMLLAVGYADPTGGIPYSKKKSSKLILEDISS